MLRCVDETGWDAAGEDEFRLRALVDKEKVPFLSIDWDDADSGEYWPRGSVKIEPIGYLERLIFNAWESDFTASAVWGPLINPLPPDEAVRAHAESFKV